jgi:eukaryotic-like serine/threonine-protein kinase
MSDPPDFVSSETLVGDSIPSKATAAPPLGGITPGTKVGAYVIKHELGRGAMGAVFEGVHATLGRRAAIKVLLPSGNSGQESLDRFLREGQAASRIRHPNVVEVYDVGVEGNAPFLVMEPLEGEDFANLLVRESPLTVERVSDIMIPVLCALASAHELGIIHRDLKPSNIFLARGADGESSPKIVDFGIS